MKPSARLLRLLLCIVSLLALLPGHARSAQDGALERILARGEILLGHRESSVPFSYYGEDGTVQGYSHELALHVVAAIRLHLDKPDLPVRLVPITPLNRIARMRAGAIDLECGSTTHNQQRARQVGFSNTIFIIGTRLLTGRHSGIHDYADLAGRRVVTTAGTTSERLLRQMQQEQQLAMTLITRPDHRESFLTLERGEADAFMMDDALLYGELAKAADPAAWVVTGAPRSFEAYACMLPARDPAFKRVVDQALHELMTRGEAERIYRRWFTQPLPGSGLNLNFPLSDAMKALYRAPNDRPFQ